MKKPSRLFLCLYASVCLTSFFVEAFNPDRTIYKWSPLWFNNYMRRGPILHKRFRDEPITKWNPATFSSDSLYYQYKRDQSDCGRENSPCSFLDEFSGELTEIRCCGPLKCLPNGDQFSCLYPGYRSFQNNDLDYFYA